MIAGWKAPVWNRARVRVWKERREFCCCCFWWRLEGEVAGGDRGMDRLAAAAGDAAVAGTAVKMAGTGELGSPVALEGMR